MKTNHLLKIAFVLILGLVIFLLYWNYFSKEAIREQKIETWNRRIQEGIEESIKDGDIIFQTSQSEQSEAIQLATHSKYSHCGIIFRVENVLVVLEAVQPVKLTPLKEWKERGENGHYVIKRLSADSLLTDDVAGRMWQYGQAILGKNYDSYFEWSDDKIYCSELVWKAYKKATGLELVQLQTLKDFDLENAQVKAKLKEQFGNNLPLKEKVVSPSAIFDSELLRVVYEN